MRLLILGLVAAGTLAGQEPDLGPVSERARQAFADHRFDRLLDPGASVRLRLPEQPSGPPVSRSAALAALEAFTRGYREVEVSVLGAAVLEGGMGYVELRRRFRMDGVAEELDQRILLSVRHEDGGWRVVEVWISP